MHTLRTSLMSAAGLLVCLGQLVVAQPATHIPTTTLLKRLAEAVDGHRQGQLVYVVAQHDYPNATGGVYLDSAAARAAAQRLGAQWGHFGPFRGTGECIRVPGTSRCLDEPEELCVHDGLHSAMDSSVVARVRRLGSICPGPGLGFRMNDLDSLSITFHLRSGPAQRMALPRGVDAVFLTLPALDKFVFPYYARTIGLDSTAALRQRFVLSRR